MRTVRVSVTCADLVAGEVIEVVTKEVANPPENNDRPLCLF